MFGNGSPKFVFSLAYLMQQRIFKHVILIYAGASPYTIYARIHLIHSVHKIYTELQDKYKIYNTYPCFLIAYFIFAC